MPWRQGTPLNMVYIIKFINVVTSQRFYSPVAIQRTIGKYSTSEESGISWRHWGKSDCLPILEHGLRRGLYSLCTAQIQASAPFAVPIPSGLPYKQNDEIQMYLTSSPYSDKYPVALKIPTHVRYSKYMNRKMLRLLKYMYPSTFWMPIDVYV